MGASLTESRSGSGRLFGRARQAAETAAILGRAGFEASPDPSIGQSFVVWSDPAGAHYVLPAPLAPGLIGATPFSAAFPGLGRLARLRRSLRGPAYVGMPGRQLEDFRERVCLPASWLGFRIAVPGAYRKITVAALDGDGLPFTYVKLTVELDGEERIRHEARVLEHLSRLPDVAQSVPVVRGLTSWGGRAALALEGRPGRTASRRFDAPSRDFLRRLHLATWPSSPGCLSLLARWRKGLAELGTAESMPRETALLGEGVARIAEALVNLGVPTSLAHGDFTFSNARRRDGVSGLLVFDWEGALPDALPGFDAFHFVVLPQILRHRKAEAPRAVFAWMERMWPPAGELRRELWLGFLVELGLHYALAMSRRPDVGDARVIRYVTTALERALAGSARS